MEAEAVERLRLTGAVRYFGGHVHGCEGGDLETCRCGYADLLEKIEEAQRLERGERDGSVQ